MSWLQQLSWLELAALGALAMALVFGASVLFAGLWTLVEDRFGEAWGWVFFAAVAFGGSGAVLASLITARMAAA